MLKRKSPLAQNMERIMKVNVFVEKEYATGASHQAIMFQIVQALQVKKLGTRGKHLSGMLKYLK